MTLLETVKQARGMTMVDEGGEYSKLMLLPGLSKEQISALVIFLAQSRLKSRTYCITLQDSKTALWEVLIFPALSYLTLTCIRYFLMDFLLRMMDVGIIGLLILFLNPRNGAQFFMYAMILLSSFIRQMI